MLKAALDLFFWGRGWVVWGFFFNQFDIYHIFQGNEEDGKTEKTTDKSGKRSPEYGPPFKGLSLTNKFLEKNSNSVKKEDKVFEGSNRVHVLNPKYSTPTSLPLYFYFVYQILQEKKELDQLGPVSLDICIL